MEQDWNARGDMAEQERFRDWLESQLTVLSFWKERLIERDDPEKLNQLENHMKSLNQLMIYCG